MFSIPKLAQIGLRAHDPITRCAPCAPTPVHGRGQDSTPLVGPCTLQKQVRPRAHTRARACPCTRPHLGPRTGFPFSHRLIFATHSSSSVHSYQTVALQFRMNKTCATIGWMRHHREASRWRPSACMHRRCGERHLHRVLDLEHASMSGGTARSQGSTRAAHRSASSGGDVLAWHRPFEQWQPWRVWAHRRRLETSHVTVVVVIGSNTPRWVHVPDWICDPFISF
jgi:hypothetical protein